MRFAVLHPDPRLGAYARARRAEDDVAHAVAPACAAVSAVSINVREAHRRVSASGSVYMWEDVPRMLVEAKDDVLGRLALAPLVAMVCGGYKVST